MNISILPDEILRGIPSDEELLDTSHMESLYAIRKLKLAIRYGGERPTVLQVSEPNSHGQVFIAAFDIWINKNEYQYMPNQHA